ncbi:MAG: hypothetical protein J2P18_17370, partial [Nocardia sp.]|nr:hypothetical protein [Nocardia sp.]
MSISFGPVLDALVLPAAGEFSAISWSLRESTGMPGEPPAFARTMRILRTYARIYTSDLETTTAALTAATGAEMGIR